MSKATATYTLAGRNPPLMREMRVIVDPVCPLKHLTSAFLLGNLSIINISPNRHQQWVNVGAVNKWVNAHIYLARS